MKRSVIRLAAWTLAVSALVFCASCKREGGSGEGKTGGGGPVVAGADRDPARAELLTGIYTPVKLPLPEGYIVGYETQNCTPLVDRETGSVTVLCIRENEEEDLPKYILATTDAEHGVTRTVPLPGIGDLTVSRWAFDAQGRCFFAAGKTREKSEDGFRAFWDYYLYRFDPPAEGETGGTLSEGLYLNPVFDAYNEFDILNLIADV